MVRQSRQVKDGFEDALVEGLGVDYVEQLDEVPDAGRPRDAVAHAWPVRSTSPTRACG